MRKDFDILGDPVARGEFSTAMNAAGFQISKRPMTQGRGIQNNAEIIKAIIESGGPFAVPAAAMSWVIVEYLKKQSNRRVVIQKARPDGTIESIDALGYSVTQIKPLVEDSGHIIVTVVRERTAIPADNKS